MPLMHGQLKLWISHPNLRLLKLQVIDIVIYIQILSKPPISSKEASFISSSNSTTHTSRCHQIYGKQNPFLCLPLSSKDKATNITNLESWLLYHHLLNDQDANYV